MECKFFWLLFELNLGFCGTDIPSASTSLCKEIFWGVWLVKNRIMAMRDMMKPLKGRLWRCKYVERVERVRGVRRWHTWTNGHHTWIIKKFFFILDLDFRFVSAWRAHCSHPDDLLEKMFDQRRSKNGGTHLERPQAFGFLPPLFRGYRSFQFIHGHLVELYHAALLNSS